MGSEQCPGHETFKTLKEYSVKCGKCGKEHFFFSDELHKEHKCTSCKAVLDTSNLT